MKTASRILGTAFFLEGYEVQDAPRYGAERRGAPIFAYVRAGRRPIRERGVIPDPDLVVVADDTLVSIPAAGVLPGVTEHTVLLINSHAAAQTWRERLNLKGPILALPAAEEVEDRAELPLVGAACAGAAARLVGVISRDSLIHAIKDELAELGSDVVAENLERAVSAFDVMNAHTGLVTERETPGATGYPTPRWIDLHNDPVARAAPVIHGALTSIQVRTGLWRTMRPIIDYERCKQCWWVCSTFCPDGAITTNQEGYPEIDYDHCKGCMVCVAKCPPHAIEAVPEQVFQAPSEATPS